LLDVKIYMVFVKTKFFLGL